MPKLVLGSFKWTCTKDSVFVNRSLCTKLSKRTVYQFKKNICWCKTYIICWKIFRNSREISVNKGQGWQPLFNVRDLRALRRSSMRNRHATVMNQKCHTGSRVLWKTQFTASTNSTWNSIMKRGRNISVLCRNTGELQAHVRWTKRQWKCVLTVSFFQE